MNPFEVNKINNSDIESLKAQVSTSKDLRSEKSEKTNSVSKSGVTKPHIELDDFFEYLDPKVVEKIMQTPEEYRSRIIKDVNQYEFDINGAQNILDSLG